MMQTKEYHIIKGKPVGAEHSNKNYYSWIRTDGLMDTFQSNNWYLRAELAVQCAKDNAGNRWTPIIIR